MEGAKWYDWLALILVVILIAILVAFKFLLSLFPPTMPVGMAALILWAVVLVLIIAIVVMLANGADPFKPLSEVAEKALGAVGDIIGSAGKQVGKLFSSFWSLLVAGGVAVFVISLFRNKNDRVVKISVPSDSVGHSKEEGARDATKDSHE